MPTTERPTKRSRVSRACDQCRTAREKCDGTQPTCLTCSASKRSCTYTAAPKKRGIQPGYIRTLELTLTWLFQNTDSEALLNRKVAAEGSSSVLFGKDTKESNRLHKGWRRSKFCRDVDKLLSGEQIGTEDDRTPKSDDEDSDPEVDSLPIQPPDDISPSTQFASPMLSRPTQPPTTTVRNVPETHGPSNLQTGATTSLPSCSWRLLDIYFAYTQSWLPICEKHDILKVSYSYPEKGLALSATDLSDSGDHAELWSVLAVAAHQARHDTYESGMLPDIDWLYSTARGLIPTESGSFAVGHVKALLNLAVIHLGRANTAAAWLLIGFASRVLTAIERTSQNTGTKWKHLFASCFMLDSLVSLQLRTGPYLDASDIDRIGRIEEDGLEEWQPWTAPLSSSSTPHSKTPIFGLSSFNNLINVIHILCLSDPEDLVKTGIPSHQLITRLETWKATLPAKFDYINDERKQTPLNPPALLLHLTYLCASFMLLPSQSQYHRILEILGRHRDHLGAHALPPVVFCLLDHIQTNSVYGTVDQRSQSRLQRLAGDIVHEWSTTSREPLNVAPALAPMQARPSTGSYQIPTPESIQVPFSSSFTPLSNRPPSSRRRGTTTLLDDLLPDMNPATATSQPSGSLQNFTLPPMENDFHGPTLHHRNSAASRELETFFDELASLDGAEKVDNQPQFMQNLGFAPDANMADFLAAELSSFIPANSTTFMPHNSDPTQLDPAFFGST